MKLTTSELFFQRKSTDVYLGTQCHACDREVPDAPLIIGAVMRFAALPFETRKLVFLSPVLDLLGQEKVRMK